MRGGNTHILNELRAFFQNLRFNRIAVFLGDALGHDERVDFIIIGIFLRYAADDKFFNAAQVGIFFFQIVRRNFLAGGKHNIFFRTAGDADIAVRVALAEVAGHKITVFGKRGFGRRFVAEIAFHHIRRFDENFAAVAEAHRHRGIRLAAGIGLNIVRHVAYRRNIGFGRAVSH